MRKGKRMHWGSIRPACICVVKDIMKPCHTDYLLIYHGAHFILPFQLTLNNIDLSTVDRYFYYKIVVNRIKIYNILLWIK